MQPMLNPARLAVLWTIVLVLIGGRSAPLSAADKVHVLYDNDQAVAMTKKTGRPLLAIGGTLNCPYCVKMAKQLEGDEKLAPLASKFVILKIDTSTPLWREWKERYDIEGDGVPQVVILRGDGKQIYGKTGAPVEMDLFLERYLPAAGKILTSTELSDAERLLKEAQKAFKRKDYAKAIELAHECTPENCYAGVVGEANKLLDQLSDRARILLKEAERNLSKRDKALEGALALRELDRAFARHKPAHGPIADSLAAHGQQEDQAGVFAQAALVESAQELEAARKREEALAAWEAVQEKHPETAAAALAARRIADLQKRLGTAKSTEPAKPADSGKRAASLLKLGKQLQKSNPGEARRYFERAIEADPDSEAADEARTLLEERS